MRIENVLGDGIGFIELVDHMGSDLTVANSARVSFGKRKEALDDTDIKLIRYLAKHKHWSPFRHVSFQFHVKAPEVVARQWFKHIVGAEYAFKDSPWNEISGRYIVYPEEFYIPTALRKQSDNNKQASTDEPVNYHEDTLNKFKNGIRAQYNLYKELLDAGVCKEQARLVLPFSTYTEFYWSPSLQAAVNFIKLRKAGGAQKETSWFANAMETLLTPYVPHSMEALMGVADANS